MASGATHYRSDLAKPGMLAWYEVRGLIDAHVADFASTNANGQRKSLYDRLTRFGMTLG